MIIKECIINDEDETGVSAISFVNDPANEEFFTALNKEDLLDIELKKSDFYMYTAYPLPDIIETSHEFCKKRAGKIFHISEIKAWNNLSVKENGFIEGSTFFSNFDGNGSANIDNQIYNCRHWFKRVPSSKAPKYKQKLFKAYNKQSTEKLEFKFSNIDVEKKEVVGLALKSGQLIYRNDINGEPGYIYFSRDTIRRIHKKYGYNRSISLNHNEDATGQVILLASYIEENSDKNETRWSVRYKVLNDKLWELIKSNEVRGFSVEIEVKLK